ncbi:MAG TPA: 3-phosphoshikimate 1-carboxyvinyltransferase [Lachnospiraceae bacterium]|nr:3-phosphoshikimate 1-carboxyvinyltransferase [Lachnospiraceae bacterium]
MIISIEPSQLKGSAYAPPSKSYAQRMLICAALSEGTGRIKGISGSGDMKAALDCIEALGAKYSADGDTVTVSGRGAVKEDAYGSGSEEAAGNRVHVFPCNESGNTLRFLIPVSLCFFDRVRFTGTKRLMERGISVYEELFSERGIAFSKEECALNINGRLLPGKFRVRGDISSQFITGLLLSLVMLPGDSRIELIPPVESRAYIDITEDVLRDFGIRLDREDENTFLIKGGQRYRAGDREVEGDWSNAAFLYGFNALGSDIEIKGLKTDSIQGDRACIGLFERLEEEEPVIDISGCPDLGPVLFALAAAKHGALITGTRRLKIKESDRASAMAEELGKFGVELKLSENSVFIPDTRLKKPEDSLSAHNDHRIAMALCLLMSLTGGTLTGAEAVNKTWPGFYETVRGLGLKLLIQEEL